MVTPVFRVDQDDSFIYIVMIVKYSKISSAEFDIDAATFRFSLKPYNLTLTFTGELKEGGADNKSEYDIETNQLKCQIQKATAGEYFENLDMITALMPKFPSQTPDMSQEQKEKVLKTAVDNNRPLIEVISSADNDEVEMEDQTEESKEGVSASDMDFKLLKTCSNTCYQ
jgi:hypothetical protein